jgi:L-lactate dehydrogenase complex protein LldF
MSQSKAHRRQVSEALKDQHLQTALDRAISAYRKSRAEAMEGFDFAGAQDKVRAIKQRCAADLHALLARFKEEAENVSAVVHEAKDGAEAAEIVRKLADERGVKSIVKSKSMLTEELELNRRLSAYGLQVTETDLGEWIIQLSGEKPSHFTQPAMHKTREQVAELFSKVTGEQQDADVAKLVKVARERLREAFINADMGISGANIAIAETGTIVLVSNEGNARLVTTLPPIHVAIVGIEKLVESWDDANEILKVLARSGTGQKATAYVSHITGPSRTTDIEKTLALGVHGPGELHIIFVDAGRRAMAADDKLREAAYCIKCGACLNMCPVYRSVGGHAYGNAYMGGIGSIVTAFHRELDACEDTLALCIGCGYCTSICPARIDTPGMVLELRRRLVEKHGIPIAGQIPLAALRHPGFFRKILNAARTFQPAALDSGGLVRDLPMLAGFLGGKRMPGLANKFLREILPEESQGQRDMLRDRSHPEAHVGRVALYAGCVIDYVYPEIGQAMWKTLTKSGCTALFPKDQFCCGAPALYTGDLNTVRSLAEDNIKALLDATPDYVVTGCPTCAVVLKQTYTNLLADSPLADRAKELADKVMDFSQFATDVLKLELPKVKSRKVTYHDPCHQVRGLKTSDRPRKLIQSAGLELCEMQSCDECCGFAGSYSIKQPGVSEGILKRKLDNIENTGASEVLTDCPGCIMQIRGGLLARGKNISVCHMAELIAEGLE